MHYICQVINWSIYFFIIGIIIVLLSYSRLHLSQTATIGDDERPIFITHMRYYLNYEHNQFVANDDLDVPTLVKKNPVISTVCGK